MSQILKLTPDSAYRTFQEGHLGFVLKRGVLMLNVPHDLDSCVLLTPMHETAWKGHANSPEALAMLQRTEGFALINRPGSDNPYTDIDLSAFERPFSIPSIADFRFDTLPPETFETADVESEAFTAGTLGYRVHNGILKVTEPSDPDSCVLEVAGTVMGYSNALSDEAHVMIEASTENLELIPTPTTQKPLLA